MSSLRDSPMIVDGLSGGWRRKVEGEPVKLDIFEEEYIFFFREKPYHIVWLILVLSS